jgi:hypothetical protein
MKKIMLLCTALLFAAGQAAAAQNGSSNKNIYLGGGVSSNSHSGLEGTGFQIFGGYKLNKLKIKNIESFVEVGYMDTGDMKKETCVLTICATTNGKAKGAWINYAGKYALDTDLSALARLGFDLGDDDGLMYGFGVDYKFDRRMHFRGEYVGRKHIKSLQANFVYDLK